MVDDVMVAHWLAVDVEADEREAQEEWGTSTDEVASFADELASLVRDSPTAAAAENLESISHGRHQLLQNELGESRPQAVPNDDPPPGHEPERQSSSSGCCDAPAPPVEVGPGQTA